MKITAHELKELQSSCEYVVEVCKQISTARYVRPKLFANVHEFKEALENSHQVPEDYYQFRFLDCFVQIIYHTRFKRYGLHCVGFYSNLLNPGTRLNENSYLFDDNFDNILQLFIDVCNDLFRQKFLRIQDGLF